MGGRPTCAGHQCMTVGYRHRAGTEGFMPDAERPDAARAWLDPLAHLILDSAVGVLGFHAATAITSSDEAPATLASTDHRLDRLNHAQYTSKEGPSLAALEPADPIVWKDSDPTDQWTAFRQAAVGAGIRTALAVHVPTPDTTKITASLSVFARELMDISAHHRRTADRFAAQLGAALNGADAHTATLHHAANLAEAMHTRAVIEQAKGILISEHHVTPDQAFELLNKMSQDTNTKLHEVSRRLVHERAT